MRCEADRYQEAERLAITTTTRLVPASRARTLKGVVHQMVWHASCSRPLCCSRHTNTTPPPLPQHPSGSCGERRGAATAGQPPEQRADPVQQNDDCVLNTVAVVIAEGKHPVPYRTRKLSLPAPMVLHAPACGRVGNRRTQPFNGAPASDRGGGTTT